MNQLTSIILVFGITIMFFSSILYLISVLSVLTLIFFVSKIIWCILHVSNCFFFGLLCDVTNPVPMAHRWQTPDHVLFPFTSYWITTYRQFTDRHPGASTTKHPGNITLICPPFGCNSHFRSVRGHGCGQRALRALRHMGVQHKHGTISETIAGMTSLICSMTSLPPLLSRHYPRYYDVTIPATIPSLTPLLCHHYPPLLCHH